MANPRSRRVSFATMAELKALFDPDSLRAATDMADHGEVLLVVIGASEGGSVNQPHDDKRDAWTAGQEPSQLDRPHVCRLYVPAGIVFRAPKKGETAHVLRAKDHGGPGAALMVPDGGDGSTALLPDWWGDNDSGMHAPAGETLHVSTKDQPVKIDAGGSKDVVVNGGAKKVARVDDTVDCGTIAVTPGVGGTITAVIYVDPDGVSTTLNATTPGPVPLKGKISSGADHFKG